MVETRESEAIKKHKILIIEDEALVARELKSRLTNMGCEVVGIAYGREGIELARKTKPDLLLSDIHLKDGEDGIEMAQVIQAERDVPVVFLTAYSDEDTVSRAKEITPYGYIIKPVENRELRIAIDMALYKFAIEKELKETQQLLQNALTCIGSALVFVNEAGQITNLNRDAEQILGRSQTEVLGFSWQDTLSLTGSSIQNKIATALSSKEVVKLAPFIISTAEDKSWLLDGIVGPMTDGGVLILRSLTEITDAIEVLPDAKDLMIRVGADRIAPVESSMCQLLIAPRVEGTLSLMHDVSILLNQRLRSTDLVSVYAGSQLSVSMPYTSITEGKLIADSILIALQGKFDPLKWQFSVGLAYSSPGDQQPFELFRHASHALRVARESGGNCVVNWDDEINQSTTPTGSTAEKQQEYHNLVLLWNILNVVSNSSDIDVVFEKICHHLVKSFNLNMVGVVARHQKGISSVAGASDVKPDYTGIEDFQFSALKFNALQTFFKNEAPFSRDGKFYYFELTVNKALVIKCKDADHNLDVEFLLTLVRYVATGLSRFDVPLAPSDDDAEKSFVFESDVMKGIQESVQLVAPTDATVLISGESGTGKEVIARSIHDASVRHSAPFIIVDCGAVVSSLIESELFGHVKGAFTGADKAFSGRLREAEGGTVLLDEIGELPTDMQVKILRFVQDREIASVGSSQYDVVNTRVIAASHRDLNGLVAEGKFREDLYYRLNVFTIECPPLRKRAGDIPLLAKHFLKHFSILYSKEIVSFTDDAEQAIMDYEWPGNIRELMNVVNRAVILCKDYQLSTIHLGLFPKMRKLEVESTLGSGLEDWLNLLVEQCTQNGNVFPPIGQWLEEDLIQQSLLINNNILNRAAQSLGIPESTLRRRVNRIKEADVDTRSPSWNSSHEMVLKAIEMAQGDNRPVFDLVADALLSVLGRYHFAKKDAASLLGVSLPTYRRLLSVSS
ncbi:MAG: hydrogenase-4 transcriptional activator [Candidatus Azotimanducaceae bacterium]|jgi:hydrogenase-4 transcriptional activator